MDERRQVMAARMHECVDATLKVIDEMIAVAKNEYGHSTDEAMLHIAEQFERRADRVAARGDHTGLRADYVNYCGALVTLWDCRRRIAELEDAVKFRDDMLHTLGELDSL